MTRAFVLIVGWWLICARKTFLRERLAVVTPAAIEIPSWNTINTCGRTFKNASLTNYARRFHNEKTTEELLPRSSEGVHKTHCRIYHDCDEERAMPLSQSLDDCFQVCRIRPIAGKNSTMACISNCMPSKGDCAAYYEPTITRFTECRSRCVPK